MGAAVSPHIFSHSFLMLFSLFSIRTFSWDRDLCDLLQHGEGLPVGCSSSLTAPVTSVTVRESFRHSLPQHESPRGHKSCQQSCYNMGSSLHGATAPARRVLQHGIATPQMLVGAGRQSAVPWSPLQAAGEFMLQHLTMCFPSFLTDLCCSQIFLALSPKPCYTAVFTLP